MCEVSVSPSLDSDLAARGGLLSFSMLMETHIILVAPDAAFLQRKLVFGTIDQHREKSAVVGVKGGPPVFLSFHLLRPGGQ